MLTQVVLQTANPVSFDIDSVDPDEIVILKSISGLSPSDVTLFTGEFAKEGGYYQGRRSNPRNPVFNLKLNPNYVDDISVSDVREMLYRQFLEPQTDSDGVQVLLVDDRKPDRYFIGYTEKFPAEIFSADTSAQISMICTDPYLRSAEETVGSNPAGWISVPLTYEGSADTGIELTIKVVTANDKVIIENNAQTMTLEYAFAVDDIITVNTTVGNRVIQVNGDDIMAALTANSDWISLKSAANTLRVYGDAPSDGKASVTAYSYRAAWWGV